jgi:hypothetical protein
MKRARIAFMTSSIALPLSRQPGRLPPGFAEDPWLCVPASRRVCPGRESRIGQRTSLAGSNATQGTWAGQ